LVRSVYGDMEFKKKVDNLPADDAELSLISPTPYTSKDIIANFCANSVENKIEWLEAFNEW